MLHLVTIPQSFIPFSFAYTLISLFNAPLTAAASATELFVRPNPEVDFKLARVERLAGHDVGVEEAVIAFNLRADLRPCFSANFPHAHATSLSLALTARSS